MYLILESSFMTSYITWRNKYFLYVTKMIYIKTLWKGTFIIFASVRIFPHLIGGGEVYNILIKLLKCQHWAELETF